MRDLTRLTRVREIWERRERARVAAALAEARAAASRVDDAERLHRDALDAAGTVPPLLAFTVQTATAERRAQALRAAEHAELQAEASRGVWRRSKQDLDIAERLEEHRREALATEERRVETKQLDEMASIRHGRQE